MTRLTDMSLLFRTVRLGSPRQPQEGLRIGAVRFLPRGVPKSAYAEQDLFDVWLPTLAPSRELLQKTREGNLPVRTFEQRYRTEMAKTEPRQVIQLLAALAKTTPISAGCYCADESNCHRRILGQLIREAAGEPAIRPLAERCVYTIVHRDRLDTILKDKRGADVLTERKRWRTALDFWHVAQTNGQRLPIVFADATDCSRLFYWAQLDFIELDEEHTRYRFSELQPIRGRHTPQELVLCDSGENISPGYIRPYALVQTPTFLR